MPKETYFTRIGDRYGSRVITALLKERDSDGHLRCRWHCDCGATGTGGLKALRLTQTCSRCRPGDPEGCRKRAIHGHAGVDRTKLYDAWGNMMQRVRGTGASRNKKWYFDKGIRVCVDWQSFTGFRDWAFANGWREGLSLDRIDPRKNYQPDNCEWITREENSRRAATLLKRLYALRELQSSQ